MSIREKGASLQKRIDHLKSMQETAAESAALSKRLAEVRELEENVRTSLNKIRLLKENQIPFDKTVIDQVDPTTPLRRIIERFDERPEAASLSKGRDWTALQEKAGDWGKTLGLEASRSWKNFLNSLSQGQSPDGLKAKLAQTDANKRTLAAFSPIYNELQSLKNEFPNDRAVVTKALTLSEQLKEISEAFDYDVPEDVRVFLAAIHKGGASLELLTEEVLSWLGEQRSADQYQIVGKHR